MEWKHELSPASILKLVSFLFWSGLYVWCSVKWPKQSPEWCSRLVTVLHGSVATVVGLAQCGVGNITPWRLTMKISGYHYALMVWSWGYFAFDLLWCLTYWTENTLMLCHHTSALVAITIYMHKEYTGCTFACTLAMMEVTNPLLQARCLGLIAFDLLWCLTYWTENTLMLCHHTSALVAITIYMHKEYTGCTFACTLAMMEVTNPLLQARWFLRDEGFGSTMIYLLVELTYLVLFLAVRGVLGTYVVYKITQSDIFDMDEKLITIVFYLVSLAFIKDIMGFIVHRFRSRINEFRNYLDDMGILLNEGR